MEILINKLKELIKIDEQLGTPKDDYNWTKQQGVLITSRDAEQIVDYYERMAKSLNEAKAALPLHGVSVAVCYLEGCVDQLNDKCHHTPEKYARCKSKQTER